jgi:hypothetical protein
MASWCSGVGTHMIVSAMCEKINTEMGDGPASKDQRLPLR